MHKFYRYRQRYIPIFLALLALLSTCLGFSQQAGALEGQALYDALKAFELQGKATVSNLSLKRDRGQMTFTGDFYFMAPVNGRVTGAVFIGDGTFRAEAPPIEFEQENLKRFLDADLVESDFKTAVLRFTDDTFDIIGKNMAATAAVPDDAVKLAREFEPELLKETGANISARLALSIANNESPGVFLAQFDKGDLKRFSFLLDHQSRILTANFGINAGEKVAIFRYDSYAYSNDLLIATYSEDDFENGRVDFSDKFDVVNPLHYMIEVDVTRARRVLKTNIRIDFESLVDDLLAIPMTVNDGLSAYDNKRLKDSMRVQSAQYNGQDIPCIQEDWEMGLTFLLPKAMKKGQKFSVEVALEGDFIDKQTTITSIQYLQGNTNWYPRHGYLQRSTFDLIFRHNKSDRIASIGTLVREDTWPDDSGDSLTEYKMNDPVAFAAFSVGNLQRVTQKREFSSGEMEIEFFTVPQSVDFNAIDEEFILAEMGNALDFYNNIFSPYPYRNFRASIQPFNSGQGLPTLLMLARQSEANRDTFAFIAHETSHQWWGNMVSWRSYRDQWLSEGFAEYSGLMYVLLRDSLYSQKEMLKTMRYQLTQPPRTDTGVGKGMVAEVGPMILGRRLRTRNTTNAYQLLTYDKGALVLRMLHYIFSNPSTGDDSLFKDMMKDFTTRFKGKAASTSDFIAVANIHFPKTVLAQMLGLTDLGWFFQQWVYEAKLPSYRMEYSIGKDGGGQTVITGKMIQKNAGEKWFMPLPLVLEFPGDQKATVMVWANGPETALQIPPLPMEPKSVKLDPDMWILSEKTEEKKK